MLFLIKWLSAKSSEHFLHNKFLSCNSFVSLLVKSPTWSSKYCCMRRVPDSITGSVDVHFEQHRLVLHNIVVVFSSSYVCTLCNLQYAKFNFSKICWFSNRAQLFSHLLTNILLRNTCDNPTRQSSGKVQAKSQFRGLEFLEFTNMRLKAQTHWELTFWKTRFKLPWCFTLNAKHTELGFNFEDSATKALFSAATVPVWREGQ